MEPSPLEDPNWLDDPLPQEGKQKKSSTIIRPFYVEILFLRRESVCDSEAEATSLSKQTDSSKGIRWVGGKKMFGIETMSSLDGKPRVAFADEDEEEAEDLYEEEDKVGY